MRYTNQVGFLIPRENTLDSETCFTDFTETGLGRTRNLKAQIIKNSFETTITIYTLLFVILRPFRILLQEIII